MVIRNDLYASASIVFAESIRRIGCLGKLVVMVDDSISMDTIDGLKRYYDLVIHVEPIYLHTHQNLVQQVILTKINALKLTEFEKILLIDVDTILFKNVDYIMMNTGSSSNSNSNSDDVVGLSVIDVKTELIRNYGFILIKPSIKMFKKITKFIKKNKLELTKCPKPFEYVINKNYKTIEKIPFNLSQDSYAKVDGIQYKNVKPFLMAGELSIEQRMSLDHFKIWFSYLKNIINKYPDIKKYKFMQEPLSVSVYFLHTIARFIIDMIKSNHINKSDNFSSVYDPIYGLACNNLLSYSNNSNNSGNNKDSCTQIYKKNPNYYHVDISKECANTIGSELSFDSDSNSKELESLIKYFSRYEHDINLKTFANNKNKKIREFIKDIELLHGSEKIDKNILNELIDLILKYYVKTHPNVFVVLEISAIDNVQNTHTKSEKKSNPILDYELKNNLVYTKNILINSIGLQNILFNIYPKYTFEQRLLFLSSLNNYQNYNLNIQIYETIGPIDYVDYNANTELFVFFSKDAKIRISSILFSLNSIKLFEQDLSLNIIGKLENSKNKLYLNLNKLIELTYFQTLKKWIYDNYSLDSLNNIILIPISSTEYVMIDNNHYTISDIKKISNTKVFFLKVIFVNSSQYKKILKMYPNHLKQIYNTKYHYELEGIKIVCDELV